jgi:hypothetical protein
MQQADTLVKVVDQVDCGGCAREAIRENREKSLSETTVLSTSLKYSVVDAVARGYETLCLIAHQHQKRQAAAVHQSNPLFYGREAAEVLASRKQEFWKRVALTRKRSVSKKISRSEGDTAPVL